MATLNINGLKYIADAPADTRLLWVIREHLRLTGTKFGCGMGLCGACTVHLDGEAVRSCQVELGDAEGSRITTIEGGSDIKEQIKLKFSSINDLERYAEKNKISLEIIQPKEKKVIIKSYADNFTKNTGI